MKKKAIKIAASTAVAASAFVAAAPVNKADAAVNLDQIVQDAQNAGTVLKWAISVEGSADYVTRPYAQYNAAKKAIDAADKALKGASASDKLKYEARLTDPKIQVKRAQAYIDAITSSEKIKELTANLNAAVKSDDIEKVETAYHKATAEYRKQSALLDRVYGQSTRDGIRNAVKPALEKLVAELKNDVTVNMLAKGAAADVKAGKTAEAGKKIAEAQAILDANVLKWETSLQKSVDDVLTSLPLGVTSVSRVNDTSVVVSLNKPVVAVAASEFTFDNGLVATSAVLGADKKTVTLTTTKQAAGKTYTVTYKGTTAQFVTPVDPAGNVSIDQAEVHAETTQGIALVATFKTKQGTANNNPVDVTVPAGYKVTSVNGATKAIASGTTEQVSPVDGQIVVVVTADDVDTPATGKKVKFEQLTGATGTVVETKESGKLNFYKLDDVEDLTATTGKVEYVDAANNYFVANTGHKYLLKSSGNIYQDTNNTVITLDALKAKLSKGDVVTGQYAKDSSSVLKLALDLVATAEFELDQELEENTTAFRVAGNTITFSGSGEAGKTISIYDVTKLRPVAQTKVNSNNKWEVTVPVDPTIVAGVDFSVRQAASVNEIAPDYAAGLAGATTPLKVIAGTFKTNGVAPVAALSGAADASLNGDKFTYTIDPALGDKVVVDGTSSITLTDGDLTKATFTNGVNNTKIEKVTDTTFSITFGGPVSIGGGDGKLTGSLTVSDVVGVKNEYNLKLSTSGMVNIFGY
ncbi:hypothetical protein [Cytobacillus dafuensis]|uniref:SbsC C-terminal domain-containing protein n=1 Tax=Cytobacillus dafuensis TaxID=1742359 RepID=A0A5B8Z9R6_CYTDA|nr:hypothetical protein [Cytobacillus dafuensis]QED49671.1 hypothetical protein FSZ17_21690 [Cytobacillus dafuensis]